MTGLSPHFSLEEMTITQVRGVDNTPTDEIIANLRALANELEKVRKLLGGRVLTVNSAYRSLAVNERVGGVKNSAHMLGYAADFICPGFGTPLQICWAIKGTPAIKFDQVIEEGTWVHFSVAPEMRGQILTKKPDGGYSVGLKKNV